MESWSLKNNTINFQCIKAVNTLLRLERKLKRRRIWRLEWIVQSFGGDGGQTLCEYMISHPISKALLKPKDKTRKQKITTSEQNYKAHAKKEPRTTAR